MVGVISFSLYAAGTIALGTAIAITSTVYQLHSAMKMKKKMKAAQAKAAAEADKRKGFKLPISGEVSHLPVTYGKAMLGGTECAHKTAHNVFNLSADPVSRTFSYKFKPNATGVALTHHSMAGFLAANFDFLSAGKNEFLGVQSALCHEGIEGVVDIDVNDSRYNYKDAKFEHRFHTYPIGGIADPAATHFGFPSTNKFTNCAWVHSFFKLNRDEGNYGGLPRCSYLLKGKKITPITRSGSEGNYSYSLAVDGNGDRLYTYSNNPALVLLDYLLSTKYGRGLPVVNNVPPNIDLASFYHASEICNTVVRQNAVIGGRVNGVKPFREYSTLALFPNITSGTTAPAGTEDNTEEILSAYIYKATDTGYYYTWAAGSYQITTVNKRDLPLYECNISIDTSSSIRNNIETILDTMGLAELVWSSEGKYKLLLEYPQQTVAEIAAGSNECAAVLALVDPAHRFTEDNIIKEDIGITWPTANDRFNQVTVNFANEHEDFKEDTITFPETNSAVHAAFLAEDNQQPFTSEITGIGITDPYHALAKAEQIVRQSREMKTLTVTLDSAGFNLEPGDFISLYSPLAGIGTAAVPEVFKVLGVTLKSDLTVYVEAFSYSHTMLAWNVNDDIAYLSPPEFDFTVDKPTNVVFTSSAASSSNKLLGTASGQVTWTPTADTGTEEYIVEAKELGNADSEFSQLGITRSTAVDVNGNATCKFDIQGFKTGNFIFSVRARNPSGLMSERVLAADSVTGSTTVSLQLKTVGRVAVIYADIQDHTDAAQVQTYTQGSNQFVAYYAYTGETPPSDATTGVLSPNVTTNITFAKFVGEDAVPPSPLPPLSSNLATYVINMTMSTLTGNNPGELFFGTPTNDSVYLDWRQDGNNPQYGWPDKMFVKLNGAGVTGNVSQVLHNSFTNQEDLTILIKHDDDNWGTYKTDFTTSAYDYYFNTTTNRAQARFERQFAVGNLTAVSSTTATIGVGANATRGAGWWKHLTGTANSVTGLLTGFVEAFFGVAVNLLPVYGDRFVLENTGGDVTAYVYEGSSGWVEQTQFIDGNLLVSGTITGTKLAAASIVTNTAQINDLVVGRIKIADNGVSDQRIAAGGIAVISTGSGSVDLHSLTIPHVAGLPLLISAGIRYTTGTPVGTPALSSTQYATQTLGLSGVSADGAPYLWIPGILRAHRWSRTTIGFPENDFHYFQDTLVPSYTGETTIDLTVNFSFKNISGSANTTPKDFYRYRSFFYIQSLVK